MICRLFKHICYKSILCIDIDLFHGNFINNIKSKKNPFVRIRYNELYQCLFIKACSSKVSFQCTIYKYERSCALRLVYCSYSLLKFQKPSLIYIHTYVFSYVLYKGTDQMLCYFIKYASYRVFLV